MERQIGEKFDYDEVKLEVVEIDSISCLDCYFCNMVYCRFDEIVYTTGCCSSSERKDKKEVIFKKVE